LATQAEFAAHVGISQPVVATLVARGIIDAQGRGKIDLDAARLAYCAHLRSLAGGGSGDTQMDLDLSSERARVAKEQADRLEMQNAQLRGELLARGDVDAAVGAAFARVRAKMLTVPSKTAAEVVAMGSPTEAEALIRDAVCDALEELAATTVADLLAGAAEAEGEE